MGHAHRPALLAGFFLAGFAALGCEKYIEEEPKDDKVTSKVVTGCDKKAPTAPGGYYVSGNTICTEDGKPHLFHGIARPSLEWAPAGQNFSREDFDLMATDWNANVVRIALNQSFWLAESPYYVDFYKSKVDELVKWGEQAGMDVILDLHWSDRGKWGDCYNACQQLMADEHSLLFWKELAERYKGDGRVAFELYNEPFGVSWSVWRDGGPSTEIIKGEDSPWTVVGMQQLYDAVRETGAQNLIIVGGLQYAYDLSGVRDNALDGYNILYASHPYNNADFRRAHNWDRYWGFLTADHPVILTEFGDNSGMCTPAFNEQLIAYADAHNVSWTGWAWFKADECQFPSVLRDWDGTPTNQGAVVRDALRSYNDPAPGGRAPAD